MDKQKYILFVLGPTGSGKSQLPNAIINKFFNYNNEYESILIDDLVEKNPYYKEKVKQFIENKKNENINDESIIQLFLNPTDQMYDYFNKSYYEGRTKTNCNSGNNKEIITTCDKKNDTKINNAFNNNKNIVIESTGTSFPQWFFDLYNNLIEQNEYKIIMAWSALDICNLLVRNKTRAEKSVRDFLKNQKINPPRLPDLRIDKYKSLLNSIIKTFENIINNNRFNYCKKINNTNNINKKCNPIQILLYDNTNELNLIYNSDDNTSGITNNNANNAIEKINDLYNVNKECQEENLTEIKGGFRKYKRKTNKKKNKKKSKKNKKI